MFRKTLLEEKEDTQFFLEAGLLHELGSAASIQYTEDRSGGQLNVERRINRYPDCWEVNQGAKLQKKKLIIHDWAFLFNLNTNNRVRNLLKYLFQSGFEIYVWTGTLTKISSLKELRHSLQHISPIPYDDLIEKMKNEKISRDDYTILDHARNNYLASLLIKRKPQFDIYGYLPEADLAFNPMQFLKMGLNIDSIISLLKSLSPEYAEFIAPYQDMTDSVEEHAKLIDLLQMALPKFRQFHIETADESVLQYYLDHLNMLAVSICNFTGVDISKKNLKKLLARNPFLIGLITPNNIVSHLDPTHCKRMTELSIDFSTEHAMIQALQDLTQLRKLNFDIFELSSSSTEQLGATLSLTELTLRNAEIKAIQHYLSGKNCPSLKTLSLSCCSAKDLKHLIEYIHPFTLDSLEINDICLASNALDSEENVSQYNIKNVKIRRGFHELKVLHHFLSHFRSSEYLSVELSISNSDETTSKPIVFPKLKHLQLIGKDIECMFNTIDCPNLASADLSSDDIELLSFLNKHPKLKRLSLKTNSLTILPWEKILSFPTSKISNYQRTTSRHAH